MIVSVKNKPSITSYVKLEEQMYDNLKEDGKDASKVSFNTMSHTPYRVRPSETVTGRLTIYFALTAFMTAVILSIVLAVVWEDQFQTYTRRGMQHMAQKIALSLGKQYSVSGGWKSTFIRSSSLTFPVPSDVGIEIVDAHGQLIYGNVPASSYARDNADHIEIIDSKSDKSNSASEVGGPPEGDHATATADIVDNSGEYVGNVRLWAFGSETLITKSDDVFRKNSYGAILAAAVIAILLACALSYAASHVFVKPIKKITSTAAQIRNGDLTARTNLTGDDEIGRLGETFDSMASELERDIKFEHRLTSDVAHELRTPLMAAC